MVPHATTAEIGAILRSARQSLHISVEEAAWRTRIKPDYLRALEEERYGDIGHLAIARRHLHTYARYLGLEADALAQEYERRFELTEPSPIERLNEQVKEARRPPKPKWLIAALLSSAVLIVAGVTGVVRGPGPRAPADDALGSLSPRVATQPSPSAPAVAAIPPASAVSVIVVADGRSWLRAVVDGELVFEGTLEPGATKSFEGASTIDIVIGNAGATRLTVNGEEVGRAGRAGEVYRASFGPDGEIAPQ